jgi:hypothetical protein
MMAGAPGPCRPGSTPSPHIISLQVMGPLVDPPEPSGTFPELRRKNPELFRNLNNHFPYMNLILRTTPELLVMSWIPSETPNTSVSNSYSNSTYATSNLKRVTLRFVKYADIVETSLRPITNSGTWRSIMAPTYSTIT